MNRLRRPGLTQTRPAMEIRPDPLPDTGTTGVGPRCGPSVGAASDRPRPGSRSRRRAASIPFSRRPHLPPPGRNRRLVTFDRTMPRDLHRPAHPVQQIPGAAQRVAGVKHPRDQIRHPGQGPALILAEAVHGRAFVQGISQTTQPGGVQPGAEIRQALSTPGPAHHRAANAAASRTPRSVIPAAGPSPRPPAHLRRTRPPPATAPPPAWPCAVPKFDAGLVTWDFVDQVRLPARTR